MNTQIQIAWNNPHVGKGRRNREERRTAQAPVSLTDVYDPRRFPPDDLYEDKSVAQLGAPIDGWTPELVYRYTVLTPKSLCVD